MLFDQQSVVLLAVGLGLLPFRPLLAQPSTSDAIKVTITPARTWSFGPDKVQFDTNFPRGRLTECEQIEDAVFSLLIRPENKPINHSPWFAFKVSAARKMQIELRLRCEGGSIRYRPKISADGRHWITLPAESFHLAARPEANQGILTLEVGPEPLWVAAQEFVSREELEAWSRSLERLPFVTREEIGRSIQDRPLYKLDIGEAGPGKDHLIIIGRQHPPEVTGSLALMRFVEEIVGDSDLAQAFRKQCHVLVVPLLNPDGVDLGHWRHNLGGVDLNRDWGIFAQPETRAVRDQIFALKAQGKIVLHLDFHSTFHDVFYTQTDEPMSPDPFTKPWIEGIQRRFPDYKVSRSPSGLVQRTTSQSWVHHTFGVPAITYELGDNSDRALLRQIAAGAAQEMMQLLIASKKGEATGNAP
jgi:cytosolic carboxypeptidase protein 6